MAGEESKSKGMRIRFVRNFPMPGTSWFDEKNTEAAMDYVPNDDDIVLCTYPKTGTTWMTYIIWGIFHNGKEFPTLTATLDAIPLLEFQNSVETVKNLPKPRFYKQHLPGNLSQWNPKAKYIYVYRHPEDVIASYFPFSKETTENNADFDTFFDHFISGNVAYGDYFEHISSFYKHKNEPNLFLVSYEDLKADPRTEILRIAKFLGNKYFQELTDDESNLEKVLEISSFDYMKKNLKTFTLPVPGGGGGNRDINLFRKGKVGDGKILLNEKQQSLLKKIAMEKLKDTDIVRKWYPE